MNPRWLALPLLLLPKPGECTPAFHDAFRAQVEVRRLEREVALQPYRADLDPEERETEQRATSAKLTEARIAFHGILRTDAATLTAWEKSIVEPFTKPKVRVPAARGKREDPEALKFLAEAFPRRRPSPLEWEVSLEWFGRATQEAFLKERFELRELPAVAEGAQPVRVLWVRSPFGRLLGHTEDLDPTTLGKKLGAKVKVETLELSAFLKVEDQATEAKHFLANKLNHPVVVLTTGAASAVMYQALDLYPGLRLEKNVLGWLNVNGHLYGEAPGARSPATSADPTKRIEQEAKAEFVRLYRESQREVPPVREGFPILNVFTLNEKTIPEARRRIAAEGRSWYARQGGSLELVRRALPLVPKPAEVPAGAKSLLIEDGF